MKAKYCIVPDKNKFFAFLAEQSLTEAELLRARLIQPEKIFMDIEAAVWHVRRCVCCGGMGPAPADGGCFGGQSGFYGGDTRGVLPPVGAERS